MAGQSKITEDGCACIPVEAQAYDGDRACRLSAAVDIGCYGSSCDLGSLAEVTCLIAPDRSAIVRFDSYTSAAEELETAQGWQRCDDGDYNLCEF